MVSTSSEKGVYLGKILLLRESARWFDIRLLDKVQSDEVRSWSLSAHARANTKLIWISKG